MEEHFILGSDVSLEVCLGDGRVSLWEKENGNRIHVYSYYHPETEVYNYSVLPEQTWSDIKNNYLEDLIETPSDYDCIFNAMDRSIKQIKRLYHYAEELGEIDIEMETIWLLEDWQNCYGMPFRNFRIVKTLKDFKRRVICEGKVEVEK